MITNDEAKAILAGRLKDRIVATTLSAIFRVVSYNWKSNIGGKQGAPIKDTEWQGIAWEVEETFIHKYGEASSLYQIKLRDVVHRTKHSGISIENAIAHRTWQQVAEAMKEMEGKV